MIRVRKILCMVREQLHIQIRPCILTQERIYLLLIRRLCRHSRSVIVQTVFIIWKRIKARLQIVMPSLAPLCLLFLLIIETT